MTTTNTLTQAQAERSYCHFINDMYRRYLWAKFAYEKCPKRFTNEWLQSKRLAILEECSLNYAKAVEAKDILINFLLLGVKAGICKGQIVITE